MQSHFSGRYVMNEQPDNQEKTEEKQSSVRSENLIHLNEKQIVSALPDLNAKLRDIESELKHLNAREAATNKSFLELTSETRKNISGQDQKLDTAQQQITDINQQYKKIGQDYQRIAAASNLLGAQMEKAVEDINEKIDSVDVAAMRKAHELENDARKISERAGRIEQRATQLANDLDSRIEIMQTTLQSVESRIMQEISELAQQSEQRDEALTIRADKIEEETAQQIAQLDNVDKKLRKSLLDVADQSEQRDDSLAIRIDKLEEETLEQVQNLKEADTDTIQDLEVLSSQVDVVEARLNESVSKLEQANEDLSFQASVLNTRTEDVETALEKTEEKVVKHSFRLKDLGRTIERHHTGFAIALVLIAITLAVVGYNQQTRWHDLNATEQKLSQSIASQAAAQQENTAKLAAMGNLESSVIEAVDARQSGLNSAVNENGAKLNDLQKTVQELKELQENNRSRMTSMVPGRSYGLDNTIHSPQWLSQQNAAEYVIEVVTVESRQDMFDAAFRWASLLNQSNLSYVEKQVNGKTLYTLIYGTFSDRNQAEKISRYMPVVSFDNQPAVKILSDVVSVN